jgi:phage terminase large subunit GpA-like protein
MSLRLPEAGYRALCKSILRRDGWQCKSCGSRSTLHVHHIIFRSQSGPDVEWNLITVCSACHDGIHKDVKHGVYGLVIVLGEDHSVKFVRNWGWKPHD